MPHVDDGTLHALLDGALRVDDSAAAAAAESHLSGCEDCRARLESAAEVRERASGILADADPVAPAATPDFEEVRARARAGDAAPGTTPGGVRRHAPATHRQARWTRGIAWAASLVLALGTGYLLHDLVDVPSAGDPIEAPAASPAPASDAAEPLPGGESTRDRQDGVTGSAEQEASAPSPGASADGAASRRDPGAEDEVEAGATDARPQRTEDRAGSFVESRETPSLPSIRASGSVVGAQWSAATLAEARAAIEGPVYRLPRAEITEIYIESTGESDTRPRILTMQRLQTGVPLQVVQRWGESAAQPGDAVAGREADDAGAGALPQPEVARATRGAYILEVTGSLPEELLEILAESATPAT